MQKTIIKKPGRFSLNLTELWSYKELFYYFAWRDIKVRYKQSVLGFLWAILQPLALVAAFMLFIPTALFADKSDMHPFLFYFSGLLVWNVFSQGITSSGNSILENSEMIKKIYFPRLIIPVSSIIVALFDFMMAMIVFIVGALILVDIDWTQLPLVIANFFLSISITVMATLGIAFLLSALTVKYRDFRYVVGFMVQILFFLSPIIFTVQSMVEKIGIWAYANPLTGAISLMRSEYSIEIWISVASAAVLFVVGLIYFRSTEAYFADLV